MYFAWRTSRLGFSSQSLLCISCHKFEKFITSFALTNLYESEMGYRGSKSVLLNSTVKEQRVDGSWSNYLLSSSLLRCTLMGFERNYQIKVLSKQLNKKNFCTSANAQVHLTKLDPWFVTGFCDAVPSFSVSIYKDKRIKGRAGWVVKPSFQISLHSRDMQLLLQLQEFFACGSIVSLKAKQALE